MLSIIFVPILSGLLLVALFFLLKTGRKKDPIALCQYYISNALELLETKTVTIKLLKRLDFFANRAKQQCYFVAFEDALEINRATVLLTEARDISAALKDAHQIIFDSDSFFYYFTLIKEKMLAASDFIFTTLSVPLKNPTALVSKSQTKEDKAKQFLKKLSK